MALFEYVVEDNVAIVTMTGGENRFNFEFFDAFHQILDEIEAKPEISVLVVNSSDEKIWSNGIDLEWISKKMEEEGADFFKIFGVELYRLFARILTFPMITIAAITGHAFAGGAIMACAFDYRYMRKDRGWFCFPEVDVGIPFTDFLNEVALTAIPISKLNQMQVTAERLTAEDCKQHNIVEKICSLEEMMPVILEFGKNNNKNRQMIKTMKDLLYQGAIKVYEKAVAETQKAK